MEITTTTRSSPTACQDTKNNPSPSPLPSPNSNGTHKLSTSPLPISRSDPNNPYPTTFVQADTTTFKQVVQMLTRSIETAKQAASGAGPSSSKDSITPAAQQQQRNFTIPPIKTAPKRQGSNNNSFKLYERRNSNNFKNTLMMINTFNNSNSNSSPLFTGISPRNNNLLLSPSMLDFPKLTLSSPVTPLNHDNQSDPFNKTSPMSNSIGNSSSCSSSELEERAIAEKGFYLHPSPMSTPRDSEPKLLPLFPVTSPRLNSGSSS